MPGRYLWRLDSNEYVVYLEVEDILVLYGDREGMTRQEVERFLMLPARLEAALARPIDHAQYAEADLAQQASVLAEGIAVNHAFEDGNKRTALGAMLLFLRINGWTPSDLVSQREREDWMIHLVTGHGAEELATRLREVLVEVPVGDHYV